MSTTEIVGGIHAVRALIERSPDRVSRLHLARNRDDPRILALLELAQQAGVPVARPERQAFQQLGLVGAHQGVAVEVQAREPGNEVELHWLLDGLGEAPLLLALDGVTDPRNLGACIRSAEAAGAHAVIQTHHRAAALNAAARKAAAGAAELLPLYRVTNLARALTALRARGCQVAGAAPDAPKPIQEADLSVGVALVLGAEDRGLRRLTREACDQLVSIPQFGVTQSLNVSVAAAICLFEAARQRH